MNRIAAFCCSMIALALAAGPAAACPMAGPFAPYTVEQLYRIAAYVVYAEGGKVLHSAQGDRVSLKILEHFKGPQLHSIPVSDSSCQRQPSIGQPEVYFLDPEGRGHVMAYPVGQSVEQILATLRSIKAQSSSGKMEAEAQAD
ncbi:hypothetical protein [Massilia scottii]|uniref:hypothetical protein n=1 Tax=Massilia scottii TaxID=3057166 RepID=UPI00279645A6|nr:hypothetical protein [Massilia sp. CCM 9029]MDQ1829789.1 hypothetical protein [Massilia sp. CCM 9029]